MNREASQCKNENYFTKKEHNLISYLDDPSMNKAAMKIQAAFKGYKVRKEIKQQECPVFGDTFKDYRGEPGGTLHLECVALGGVEGGKKWFPHSLKISRYQNIFQSSTEWVKSQNLENFMN
uniref:Uncharacterized protein n=1 Tax=Pelusios castaneus TaxID=367368 RepID=A0A8C8RRL6_9SAUR